MLKSLRLEGRGVLKSLRLDGRGVLKSLRLEGRGAVSYTHLTLPTIDDV